MKKYGPRAFQRRVGRIHTIPGHDFRLQYTAVQKLGNPYRVLT